MLLSVVSLHAQSIERQVIAAGGQSTQSTSFTIGEAIIHGKGILSITAGFQQPGIIVNDPVLDINDISTMLNIYPNPSPRYVNIKGGELLTVDTKVDVFNFEGKQLNLPVSRNDGIVIDFENLTDGIYFLVIRNPVQQSIAKFKILKSK